MEITFTKIWRGYKPGDVADIKDDIAQQLLSQGLATSGSDSQQQLFDTEADNGDDDTDDGSAGQGSDAPADASGSEDAS